jgi:hypothetical protein
LKLKLRTPAVKELTEDITGNFVSGQLVNGQCMAFDFEPTHIAVRTGIVSIATGCEGSEVPQNTAYRAI